MVSFRSPRQSQKVRRPTWTRHFVQLRGNIFGRASIKTETLERLVGRPGVGHYGLKIGMLGIPTEYATSELVAGNCGRGISWSPIAVTNLEVFASDVLNRLDDLAIRRTDPGTEIDGQFGVSI